MLPFEFFFLLDISLSILVVQFSTSIITTPASILSVRSTIIVMSTILLLFKNLDMFLGEQVDFRCVIVSPATDILVFAIYILRIC